VADERSARRGDADGDGAGHADLVLVICTGNAARSVMAGYMLERLSADGLSEGGRRAVQVATAGTHTVEGQPMSMRTRGAIGTIAELADAPAGRHRSHQMTPADAAQADLIVAMEADHVRYVRRQHPAAASKTATIRYLSRSLPPGAEALASRVAGLQLQRVELDAGDDVADPAGHEEEVYVVCAGALWDLCRALAERL
jgi:protein-tyrosine-phosphatase